MADYKTELLRAAQAGGRLMAARARMKAQLKTGDLRRSIGSEAHWDAGESAVVITVYAGGDGAPQARWKELGTGVYSVDPLSSKQPIVIKPKKPGGVLAWPKSGKFVRLSGNLRRTPIKKALAAGTMKGGDVFAFAKQVIQQGLKPHPFLKPAVEESLAEVDALMAKAAQNATG